MGDAESRCKVGNTFLQAAGQSGCLRDCPRASQLEIKRTFEGFCSNANADAGETPTPNPVPVPAPAVTPAVTNPNSGPVGGAASAVGGDPCQAATLRPSFCPCDTSVKQQCQGQCVSQLQHFSGSVDVPGICLRMESPSDIDTYTDTDTDTDTDTATDTTTQDQRKLIQSQWSQKGRRQLIPTRGLRLSPQKHTVNQRGTNDARTRKRTSTPFLAVCMLVVGVALVAAPMLMLIGIGAVFTRKTHAQIQQVGSSVQMRVILVDSI